MMFYRNFLNTKELGISLFLLCTTIGMYLNFLSSNNGFTNVVIFVSLLFLFPWECVGHLKFSRHNTLLHGVLCVQLMHMMYVLLSDIKLSQSNRVLLMIYVTISFVVLLQLIYDNCKDAISIERLKRWIWIISSICNVFGFYLVYTGVHMDVYEHSTAIDDNDNILDSLTMAYACVFNVLSSLFLLNKSGKKYVYIASVVFSFILMFLLEKRTPVFVSFMIVFFFIKKHMSLKSMIPIRIIVFLIIFIAINALLFILNDTFYGQMRLFFERFFNGFNDMLYGTKTSGMSAMSRYNARQFAFSYIENFSIFDVLWGKNLQRHLDLPLIQSFVDMGLIGLGIYVYYIIKLPLKYSIKFINSDLMFCGMISFYGVFCSFNSGTPYGFMRWGPVSLLVFYIMMYNSNCKKNKNESIGGSRR